MPSDNLAEIRPDTVLIQSTDVLTNPVKEGLAMMDVQSGNYYGLDDIGSRIWQDMDGKRTMGEICTRLTAVYAVSYEECWRDVAELAARLVQNKLATRT